MGTGDRMRWFADADTRFLGASIGSPNDWAALAVDLSSYGESLTPGGTPSNRAANLTHAPTDGILGDKTIEALVWLSNAHSAVSGIAVKRGATNDEWAWGLDFAGATNVVRVLLGVGLPAVISTVTSLAPPNLSASLRRYYVAVSDEATGGSPARRTRLRIWDIETGDFAESTNTHAIAPEPVGQHFIIGARASNGADNVQNNGDQVELVRISDRPRSRQEIEAYLPYVLAGMGPPVTPVTQLRQWEEATCRHVVFFDGLPYGYTDDESGDLWGSGPGSWIGLHEYFHPDFETLGAREIKPGLIMPNSLPISIDIKEGFPQQNSATFKILDEDGHLVELFGTDGKPYEVLGERIAPGTDPLPAQVFNSADALTDIRDKNVGHERIGPDGERRAFPCLPYQLIGQDHAVLGGAAEHLGPVRISDDPLDFAGRMMTVYRIYKDLNSNAEGPIAWPLWREQHEARNLMWWGKMRDAGEVGADRVWEIKCFGPESWFKSTLGHNGPTEWIPVLGATASPNPDHDKIAVGFLTWRLLGVAIQAGLTYFDASIFDDTNDLTATSRPDLISEIRTLINGVIDGTNTNVSGNNPDGTVDSWVVTDADPTSQDANAGVDNNGSIWIRKAKNNNDQQTGGHALLRMAIVMHESRWAQLGFDPKSADLSGQSVNEPHETSYDVEFRELIAGEEYLLGKAFGQIVTTPTTGYYEGLFSTIAIGSSGNANDFLAWSNDGHNRYFRPKYEGGALIIYPGGGQVIRIQQQIGETYIEAQPTMPPGPNAEVPNGACTASRLWVMRGQFSTLDEEGEPTDAEERFVVFQGSWIAGGGTQYGAVLDGEIYIERFLDPRLFGFDNEPITIPWMATVGGDAPLDVLPLNSYAYQSWVPALANTPERPDIVWSQVILSTGSGDGITLDAQGIISNVDKGENDISNTGLGGDIELADLGLGIPNQMVVPFSEVQAAFAGIPGGQNGPLNRARYAYVGPFQARDLLQSITATRGLWWSFADKQIGLFRINEIDLNDPNLLVIDEDALFGTPGDPTSVYPRQQLRATGQIDKTICAYRNNPVDGSGTSQEHTAQAKDPGARGRTGDLEHHVQDHGLAPGEFFGSFANMAVNHNVPDWRHSFDQLWGRELAEFFAKRHFIIEVKLKREVGQDAMPGTPVLFSNPWPVDGEKYGAFNKVGRIIEVAHNKDYSTTAKILIFAGQGADFSPAHFGPVVRIVGVDGNTLTYDDSQAGMSVTGFVAPLWADAGGNAEVHLYQRLGTTWTHVASGAVSTLDTSASTITLTAPLTAESGQTVLRDRDKLLVLAPPRTNAAPWVQQVFGWITDNTLDGRPWQ